MSFLKKLGSIIVKGAAIAAGYGPMLGALIPGAGGAIGKVTDTLQQLVGVIIQVEAVGQVLNTPGADKLRAATPLVAAVILSSDAMTGRKIKDRAKFDAGCAQLAGGLADILNSFDDDIQVQNKAA